MAMLLVDKKEIEENGEVFIIETHQSDKTGNKNIVKYPKPSDVPKEPEDTEPTQLDRIESMVAKSNEEIAQAAIDNYTDMLMEEGVL